MSPTVLEVSLPRLHAGQREVVDDAARFNVLECGRRWGKTVLGQYQAATGMLRGESVGWFAPTYKFLEEVFPQLERRLGRAASRVNRSERRIELRTGGLIDFWTLDSADAGRGRKYHRAIVDEAGIVRNLQEAWEYAIRPTLADYQGDAWFLGTPKGRGYFHRLFAKGEHGEPDWRSWRLPTSSNPHIPPDEIEAARRDLPEAAFRQEFLGIPADDGGNPFGLGSIAACVGELSDGEPVAWGWDLAKSQDYTAGIALDAEGRVCRLEHFQRPWRETIRRIREVTHAPALVDSTGVGDPVLEELQAGSVWFEGYKFTSQSKQQIMEGLAVGIQREEIQFPDGPLRHELELFEYEYTRTGVRYSAPQGFHDDLVCALALAWHHRHGSRSARPFMLVTG